MNFNLENSRTQYFIDLTEHIKIDTMKRLLFYFISIQIAILLIPACKTSNPEMKAISDPYPSFKIKRGTNIAHWLSQSKIRGSERAVFFTEKDIIFIDSVGFDHIRIPIDEEQMWDETGKRNEDAFALLKNSLDWSRKAGLRVIVDLHILRSHYFNAKEKPLWTKPEEQDKLIAFWKDLSGFMGGYPVGMVAYELMNEPVADDPEQWNSLVARTVDSIRQWEPARVLVIGSNRWQSVTTFDQLKIPENDTNIILSYHFYEPMMLTHYGAGWTEYKDLTGDVNYPGQIMLQGNKPGYLRVYNRDTLENMMQKPFMVARRLKLPLYCGEFGVIDNSPMDSKLAWYRDMVSIFEEHDVAYANWNYKAGSFGIVDREMKPVWPEVKILVGTRD
jgi:endoglucanase